MKPISQKQHKVKTITWSWYVYVHNIWCHDMWVCVKSLWCNNCLSTHTACESKSRSTNWHNYLSIKKTSIYYLKKCTSLKKVQQSLIEFNQGYNDSLKRPLHGIVSMPLSSEKHTCSSLTKCDLSSSQGSFLQCLFLMLSLTDPDFGC